MEGVVEFIYNDYIDGKEIEIKQVTIDHGKTYMSLADFVQNVIPNWSLPIMFVRSLKFTFALIAVELTNQGYSSKYCQDKGNGYRAYPSKLKDKNYTCITSSAGTFQAKFASFKMYDADPWLFHISFEDEMPQEYYNFLLEKSADVNCISTPAKTAEKEMPQIVTNYTEEEVRILKCIRSRGGYIETYYRSCSFATAYHYDVTSLYAAVVNSIDFLPQIHELEMLEEPEQADNDHYAYWIQNDYDGYYYCEIQDSVPAGAIKMRLSLRNPYKETFYRWFNQKNAAKKGSMEYQEAKLKLNSGIGKLNKHTRTNRMYRDTADQLGYQFKLDNLSMDAGVVPHIHSYFMAKARRTMLNKMIAASRQGAKILQINTDGFFTDKPIEYDKDRFLGSLRFEYEAHNLTIYASNQYTCDEEVSIAGLQPHKYRKGQIYYDIHTVQFDKKTWKWKYVTNKFTLGEDYVKKYED